MLWRGALGPLTLALAVTGADAQAQTVTDIVVTHSGMGQPQLASREHFTGVARVFPMFAAAATSGARPSGGIVSFDAGARTAWHTHPRGQTLIVTAGVGRVQRWGAPPEEIRQGDVVWIAPGVKHWHGAARITAMTHVALSEAVDGKVVEWQEQVTDAEYAESVGRGGAATSTSGTVVAGAEPSAAQRLMGDIAPKLAQLTDSVLFGDVWARSGLSARDRSLATVSALIAMNRPDQLRSHLTLALQNGVTPEELIEVITQLAFYTGWPNDVGAVGIARQVFEETRALPRKMP